MPQVDSALVELNRLHREFWAKQGLLFEQRMQDEALRTTAIEMINRELRMGVQVKSQMSFYAALEQAAHAKERFLRQQARRGGSVKKTDALQKLIEEFIRRSPDLTAVGLRSKLEQHQLLEPIQDISDEVIYFTNSDGKTKQAKLSGLKHRLSRAKAALKSR